MRKRLFALFALCLVLCIGGGRQARADVADKAKVEGWTRLTELPAVADWGNYYFMIADYAQDLVLQLGRGVSQSSDQTKSTLWYQRSVSPYTDQSVMFTMEVSHSGSENYDYQVLRPVLDSEYVLSCKSGSSYTYRTGMEKSVTAVARINILPVTEDGAFKYFTIGNGNVDKSVYLGPWAETKGADELAAGTEVAINKSGNYIGHYIIYAILKTDYAAEQAARFERASADDPQDVSWLIKDRGFEQTTAFIGTYWTDETSNVSYGGVKANLNNNWIARYYNVQGKMSQTITGLKEGVYKVKCSGFYREGSLANNLTLYQNGTEHGYGVIYANDAQAPMKSIYAGAKTAADSDHGFSTQSGSYYVPDGTGNLAKAIATGAYDGNEVEVAVTNGTLTLGVMNTTAVASDYLPMDNFELWYLGAATEQIHTLGSYTVSVQAGNLLQKDAPSSVSITFPNRVSTDSEKVTLAANASITLPAGATASVTNEVLTISGLPTTLGSYTISIPAGAVGYQTSGVTNEAISLTYNIVEPVLSEDLVGYFYTTYNGETKFLGRGSNSSTRLILNDYGTPMQIAATDADGNTKIKCLDSQKYLFSYDYAIVYTDGAENNANNAFQVVKTEDGGYKIKANNSIATGFFGPKPNTTTDYFKLYENYSEETALVWHLMSAADYDALVANRKAAVKTAAITAANVSASDVEVAIRIVAKDAEATETTTRAENYVDGNTKDDGSRAFTKEWSYSGLDNGLYAVSIKAFNRNGVSANVFSNYQYDNHLTFMEVNGQKQMLASALDGKSAVDYCSSSTGNRYHGTIGGTDYYIPISMDGADVWFDNGKYNNEMLVNVTDGKLSIKITRDSYVEQCWTIWRDLTIEQVITSLDDYKKIANDEIASYTELGEDIRTNAQNEVNGAESIEDVITILNGVRDAENARQNGITDWSNTTLTRNIENEGVQQLLNADYSWLGAKPVLSETPAQADQPRPITIPVQRYDGNATVSITETENDYTNCFTTTASAAAGNIDCQYNAIPGHTYYYKVEDAEGNLKSKGQVSVEGMLRMIYAEGGSNMRDLGGRITVDGKRVKYGRLFRGGELHAGYQTTLTAAGIAEMQRLGIKAELDLRQDNEVNGNTASAIPGAEYLYVNLVPSGTEIIYDEPGIYQEKIKNGIHFIAENLKKGNVYYHCIWGADRTGAMSMFLECILGCQLSDIEKDYQLTSYSKAGLRPNSSFNLDGKLIAIEDLGYEGNTIQEKVVSFLKNIDVTEADITTIREQLLEENTDAMASYMSTLNTAYGKVATAAGTTFAEATTAAAAQSNINSAMAALTEVKDITSLLHNPEFEENGGTLDNWATRGDGCGKGGSTNHVGRIFDTTGSIRQTLQNMPAGTYTVKVQAFNRKGSGANESTKGEGYQKYANGEQKATSYLKLNGSQTILRNIYEDAISTEYSSGGYNPVLGINVPENTTGSALAMSSSTDGGRLYWNVATVTLDKAGDLTIGIVAPENIAGDYTVMDNFKLYYEPAGVETPTINLDQTAATTLPAIDGAYKVTSNRTLATGKWNTLCLPFDLSAEEIATTPITEVRQMSTCEITGNDAQVAFAEVSEIKAGKPYIVKVSEDWTVASDKAIVRAKTPVQSTIAEGISILGNYNPTTLNGQYYISGNKFYYADVDVPMKGYRASITLPEGTSVKAFGIDDTTDALETIEGEENADKTLYDLSGRRIAQPNYRGIYIRGGKKVVVK